MRFISKRNQVTLEAGIVIKRHRDQTAAQREAQLLKELHRAGLAVPTLLAVEENSLWLEYIPGETYESLTETMTWQKAHALAQWLVKYHEITGMLRGDVNLRNFLWTSEGCVGVDFEDPPTSGEGEWDFGRIIAFAVTYEPSFAPEKLQCGSLLLKAFLEAGGELGKIRKAYLQEILAMNGRRKNNVPITQASSFFAELGR